MCGRYSQLRSWSDLVRLYKLTADQTPLNLPPRYNIAPTQDVPVVRFTQEGGGRELVLLRWGLVPSWAKDVAGGYKMINARAETIAEKPAFRHAFQQRRCLVVADGFYEWAKTPTGRKQPYFITVAGDQLFAFAGLWESWNSPGGERIQSCTIAVTQANDMLRPIHDRMPAILDGDHFDSWLDTKAPLAEAKALLRPYPGAMTLFPVSSRVNAVRNDDPDCLAPMDLLSCPVTRPEVPYNPAAG
jgi:putative SOS response-associated peptidase YedK